MVSVCENREPPDLLKGGVAPQLLTGVVEVEGADCTLLHQQGLELEAANNTHTHKHTHTLE